MGFTRFDELEVPQPTPGYGLRTFQPGDEDAWVALLSSGDFGAWDRGRLDRMLAGERARLLREGIFFATDGDQLVGTACVFLHHVENVEIPELGWVVVDPNHRRCGVGRQVCLTALGFVRDLGHEYVYLLTEDYRLSAINMYLRLGFEPE